MSRQTFDVAVIGAGVFGAWGAYQLRCDGADVVLIDAYGPGNSRASSGGESRMIRMGYGPDEIYTRMAQRSLTVWQELFNLAGSPQFFQPTGILWLARDGDAYCEATLKTFETCGVKHQRLSRSEIETRYPQLDLGDISCGILEPDSGCLMARQPVREVVARARRDGVVYLNAAVSSDILRETTLRSIQTSGEEIFAKTFIFACGPWLPKLFPSLLSQRIHVTRQEVFFFGVPETGASAFGPKEMSAWIDFGDLVYALPNLESRGYKLAIDAHGPTFDPDTGDRIVSTEGLIAARAYLSRRVPLLANAPVTETRFCQYENTSNGDFLIDRHPDFENVWLVGGGSGHGFKHGPAIGEYVAGLISSTTPPEPRFSLATKERVQERKVF